MPKVPLDLKTAESTKNRIKSVVAGSRLGPTSLHDQLFEEAGGLSNFQSEGSLPLNISQIKYHRCLLRDKPQNDELADFVDYGFNHSEFVRNYFKGRNFRGRKFRGFATIGIMELRIMESPLLHSPPRISFSKICLKQ